MIEKSIGKKIVEFYLTYQDEVIMEFEDGGSILIKEDNQCCGSRYLRTDDALKDYIGAHLLGIELKEAEISYAPDGSVHEIAFLEVKTDKGSVTFACHNEHNGFYSGITPIISEV